MFSQTAEYALRAVVWLADHVDEGPVGNQRIADETLVPPSYLSKVMQELVRAGILASRRGAGGGFVLVGRPEDITLLDVVNAVDPIRRIRGCPLHLKSHSESLCHMHARLDEAMAHVQACLSSSTIAELLNESSRPKPLVDQIMNAQP